MKLVHVILVNDDAEQNSLGFVLGLSGCRVTMVKNLQEALNWIVNHKNTSEAFDVMVIGGRTPDSHIVSTMSELRRLNAALPTLVVQTRRGRKPHDASSIKTLGLREMVTFCVPEGIVQSIKQLCTEEKIG